MDKSSLDRHIMGLDDPNAPFNKEDLEIVEYFSNCCGYTMTPLQVDYGFCPDCREGCQIICLMSDDSEIPLEDL